LLVGDIQGVRDSYLATLDALRRRTLTTFEVSSRVRLTKTPADYLETRENRRELPYEAMLASGREEWSIGDKVRVYRTKTGTGSVVAELDDATLDHVDRRDYDVDHYARVLRDTYAARLARAFTPGDFAAMFADPDQFSLFAPVIGDIRSVLHSRGLNDAV
jgi:DNA polymerase, archaea type